MKTLTFNVSDERGKEIEFCCKMCDCSKNELLRVVFENWLENNNINEKMRMYEKQQNNTRNSNIVL